MRERLRGRLEQGIDVGKAQRALVDGDDNEAEALKLVEVEFFKIVFSVEGEPQERS